MDVRTMQPGAQRFRRRMMPVSIPPAQRWLYAGLLLLLVLLMMMPLWLLDEDPGEMLAEFAAEEGLLLWPMLALGVLSVIAGLRGRERLSRSLLVIDDYGVRCLQPGRGWRLYRDDPRENRWGLHWEQIADAVMLPPRRMNTDHAAAMMQWRLQLEARDGRRYELDPYFWVRHGREDHRISLWRLVREQHRFRRDTEMLRERVEASPVLEALAGHGVEVRWSDAQERSERSLSDDFDLITHKGFQVQLGVLALAGGYALVDGFVLRSWRALEALPVAPFLMAGAVALAVLVILGRGGPGKERLGVGALCAAALMVAVWPGMMRFNAATAKETPVVDYQMVRPGYFEAPGTTLPIVDLTGENLSEYWSHLGNDPQPFRLVRGEAGFWQLDTGHFYQQTRAFYARNQ